MIRKLVVNGLRIVIYEKVFVIKIDSDFNFEEQDKDICKMQIIN